MNVLTRWLSHLMGGYALAGYISYSSFDSDAGLLDIWLIKTDDYGDIPEFPSWAILSLLLTVTLLAIFFKKRLPTTPSI